tara:strand:+ start:338 stop:622 length:285 start_codon:yes stop_codon:yes gene_type:complete
MEASVRQAVFRHRHVAARGTARRPEPNLCGGVFSLTPHEPEHKIMSTVLLIILILLIVGAVPAWPHSRSWGYAPSGLLSVLLVVLIVVLVAGGI